MALYHKYRPKNFSEVFGQQQVVRPLSAAIEANKLAHAYLFSGPRGCGKTSAARILAKSLNCQSFDNPTLTPCEKCASCIEITKARSSDVIELDAASHGGVDDTRDLRDKSFYVPATSRFRILIIDEAHMVSNAGFNALLKIVEEPPAHLIFIFATTEPEKVIPTIRSRTFHYPFRLLSNQDMSELIEKVCNQEGINLSKDALPVLLRAGGGFPRDTLSILDQLASGNNNQVNYENIRDLVGVTDQTVIDQMIAALVDANSQTLFETVEATLDKGADPRRFATDLLDHIRDLTLIRSAPDILQQNLINMGGLEPDKLLNLATRIGTSKLIGWSEILREGIENMHGTVSSRLIFEIACAKLIDPDQFNHTSGSKGDFASSLAANLTKRIEQLEKNIGVNNSRFAKAPDFTTSRVQVAKEGIDIKSQSKSQVINSNSQPKVQSQGNVTEYEPTTSVSLNITWQQILSEIRAVDKVSSVMLDSGAKLAPINEDKDKVTVTIYHENEVLAQRLLEERRKKNLAGIFEKILGKQVNLIITSEPAKITTSKSLESESTVDSTLTSIATPDTDEHPLPSIDEMPDNNPTALELLKSELGAEIIEEKK